MLNLNVSGTLGGFLYNHHHFSVYDQTAWQGDGVSYNHHHLGEFPRVFLAMPTYHLSISGKEGYSCWGTPTPIQHEPLAATKEGPRKRPDTFHYNY